MRRPTFQRAFLVLLLLLVTGLFVWVIHLFLVPILLAGVFATLFYPLYGWLLLRLRGRRGWASILCCLILVLGLMGPLYMVGHLVSLEALEFASTFGERLDEFRQGTGAEWLAWIEGQPLLQPLQLDRVDWPELLRNFGDSAGRLAAGAINRTYRGAFKAVLSIFATLFTLFYFFRDGPLLLERLRYLVPFDPIYKDAIVSRFVSVARGAVTGTLLIGVIQGVLGGLTLWVFGVGSPVLWGVVMAILSVIPAIGPWLVLYPAAAVQLVAGRYWMALGIILVTVVVILNVDNLLRPRLVGYQARMHDLMIFFSTLGGIIVLGPAGFIIGPVVAALFLALLEIYSAEFRDELERRRGPVEAQAAAPEAEDREATREG